MPANPGTALAGTASMGMGALLVYAAYRNVPVFGPDGLLTGALRTGKLQPVTAQAAAAQAAREQDYQPWYEAAVTTTGGPAVTDAPKRTR